MAKLIEVTLARDAPAHVVIGVGDVLLCNASGGIIRAGADVLEKLGPFSRATIGPDGTLLSPEGPPSKVMFHARASGSAVIELISGDPWQKPLRTVVNVLVEASRRND
jgi:hypothetical protein